MIGKKTFMKKFLKLFKEFKYFCCLFYATPVASWPSRESDVYDK